VILCAHLDSKIIIRISFIEWLSNSLAVIIEQSSMLHDFDGVVQQEIGRSTLWSVIHDCHLEV
jgi:hypothetical protein